MHTTIFMAGNRINASRGLVQAAELYTLGQVDASTSFLLLERNDDRDVPIAPSDFIVIEGNERFSVSKGSFPMEDDPILRKVIPLTMNEKQLPREEWLRHSKIGFEQLSRLDANFAPGDGIFIEIRDVPDAQILPNMRLIVQGHERFYTAPCGNVGYGSQLELDVAALRIQHKTVDVWPEGNRDLVIVRQFSLDRHWNRECTDILVQVPQGYPMAALDMFWVEPGLRLSDGRMPQNADVLENLAGKQWQRFSWHYPSGYQWNPAVDGLRRHFQLIKARFGMHQ